MQQGSSREDADAASRRVALRQAVSAAGGGLIAPLEAAAMAAALAAPARNSSVDRHMERLLRGDHGSILQDLVMAGICRFTDLAEAIRTWAPEQRALLDWAEHMARLESKETTAP